VWRWVESGEIHNRDVNATRNIRAIGYEEPMTDIGKPRLSSRLATAVGIRVGIGGWTYEPWRGMFYPNGLAHKHELQYASQRLSSIEINGTYYGAQKTESFVRWYDETPEGFVFSVKGSRFTTNRRVLAEAAPSIERFFATGVMQLKEKLGPINWQFLPTKKFEPGDFENFLKLLPVSIEGRRIRHVVEVRHDSFRVPEFVALLREYGVAAAVTDSMAFPNIFDITAPYVYARLGRCSKTAKSGYSSDTLDKWATRARIWSHGSNPDDLERISDLETHPPKRRDVFIYIINGFKPKAPAAAMALIERLNRPEGTNLKT
jgi:uncharacterized protein YecE (DUF72 family)